VYLNLVEGRLWVPAVGGSNPLTPTEKTAEREGDWAPQVPTLCLGLTPRAPGGPGCARAGWEAGCFSEPDPGARRSGDPSRTEVYRSSASSQALGTNRRKTAFDGDRDGQWAQRTVTSN
jgi:hypothetical protein